MDPSVKEGTTHVGQDGDSALAELRERVRGIGEDLATVVEKRSRDLRDGTQAGANTLRRAIRQQPAIAMGVAALAGALLALAAVPRSDRARKTSRWEAWTPHVSRADLYDVADSLQRSVTRATSGAPLATSLDRLVDALSNSEARESFNAALQKAGDWFQRMRSSAS